MKTIAELIRVKTELAELKEQDHDFRNQMQVTLFELENRAEKAERGYVPQDIAMEIRNFLDQAGCGKPGTPNTFWAMTKEIIARAEKAEAELAELRDAVAWYFECLEFAEFMSGAVSWHSDSFDEAMYSLKHAEQKLREMIGGEDA